MNDTVINLKNVSRSFTSGSGEVVSILNNVNLTIKKVSFNVIRGISGSGKTTLLRVLGLLDSDYSGEYSIGDYRLNDQSGWYMDEIRSENIGFIFQEGRLFNHLNLQKNIEIPIQFHGNKQEKKKSSEIVLQLACDFFEKDEIDKILALKPGPASGGQKQRAAIMRAFINRPAIILADEPTASLHEDMKKDIVLFLKQFCELGHTVIVVSHDTVFYDYGNQYELKNGNIKCLLNSPTPSDAIDDAYTIKTPSTGLNIFWGWKPRAPVFSLIRQAMRETFLRPLFLSLILISMMVGITQVSVFSSVIIGVQKFVNDAMTTGSRLNRVEIKPKRTDRSKKERFPIRNELSDWEDIQGIVARRVSTATLLDKSGKSVAYTAMGLHNEDPEYSLLTFIAGGGFTHNHDQLEVILTASLINELFDTENSEKGEINYADYIGEKVQLLLAQYTKSGKQKNITPIKLTVVGIILHAEGGRELYLPNTSSLVFDQYKMDRIGAVVLPLSDDSDQWTDIDTVYKIADFPWEDTLQVYTKEIRKVIPVIKRLSNKGYKPRSEIWNYKWALDIQDTAWKIFWPLLILIIVAVILTVTTNILTSAKLREAELALWRILGMRRGDIVLTQVLSTVISVFIGALMGLAIGWFVIEQSKRFLAEKSSESILQGSMQQNFDAIFSPISDFYILILSASVIMGIIASLLPSIMTAKTNPAKVLNS